MAKNTPAELEHKRSVGVPTKFRDEYHDILIQHARAGKSIIQFAAQIGVSRSTVYNWKDSIPEFLDTFTRAKEICEAYWEEKTQMAMFNRDTNAQLMKFYLSTRFGWSDKQEVDNKSSDGSMSPKEPKSLDDFYASDAKPES